MAVINLEIRARGKKAFAALKAEADKLSTSASAALARLEKVSPTVKKAADTARASTELLRKSAMGVEMAYRRAGKAASSLVTNINRGVSNAGAAVGVEKVQEAVGGIRLATDRARGILGTFNNAIRDQIPALKRYGGTLASLGARGFRYLISDSKKAGAAVDNLTSKVNRSASAQRRGAESVASASTRTSRGVAEITNNQGRTFSALSRTISEGIVPAYATLAANIFAVTAALTFLQRAGDLRVLREGQVAYAGATGKALRTLTDDIIRATEAQIGFEAAAEGAAIGTAAGLTSSQLERLAASAKNVSIVLGRDLPDAYTRLIRGVTKAEAELLDELGLIVRQQVANEKYAASLGVTVKSLSAFQRTQAFANETLTQAEQKYGSITDTVNINVNAFTQLGTAVNKTFRSVRIFIDALLGPLAELLVRFEAFRVFLLAGFAATIAKSVLPNLINFEERLTKVKTALSSVVTPLRRRARAFERDSARFFATARSAEEAQVRRVQATARRFSSRFDSVLSKDLAKQDRDRIRRFTVRQNATISEARAINNSLNRVIGEGLTRAHQQFINTGDAQAKALVGTFRRQQQILSRQILQTNAVTLSSFEKLQFQARRTFTIIQLGAIKTTRAIAGLGSAAVAFGSGFLNAVSKILPVVAILSLLGSVSVSAARRFGLLEESFVKQASGADLAAEKIKTISEEFRTFNEQQAQLLARTGNVLSYFSSLAGTISALDGDTLRNVFSDANREEIRRDLEALERAQESFQPGIVAALTSILTAFGGSKAGALFGPIGRALGAAAGLASGLLVGSRGDVEVAERTVGTKETRITRSLLENQIELAGDLGDEFGSIPPTLQKAIDLSRELLNQDYTSLELQEVSNDNLEETNQRLAALGPKYANLLEVQKQTTSEWEESNKQLEQFEARYTSLEKTIISAEEGFNRLISTFVNRSEAEAQVSANRDIISFYDEQISLGVILTAQQKETLAIALERRNFLEDIVNLEKDQEAVEQSLARIRSKSFLELRSGIDRVNQEYQRNRAEILSEISLNEQRIGLIDRGLELAQRTSQEKEKEVQRLEHENAQNRIKLQLLESQNVLAELQARHSLRQQAAASEAAIAAERASIGASSDQRIILELIQKEVELENEKTTLLESQEEIKTRIASLNEEINVQDDEAYQQNERLLKLNREKAESLKLQREIQEEILVLTRRQSEREDELNRIFMVRAAGLIPLFTKIVEFEEQQERILNRLVTAQENLALAQKQNSSLFSRVPGLNRLLPEHEEIIAARREILRVQSEVDSLERNIRRFERDQELANRSRNRESAQTVSTTLTSVGATPQQNQILDIYNRQASIQVEISNILDERNEILSEAGRLGLYDEALQSERINILSRQRGEAAAQNEILNIRLRLLREEFELTRRQQDRQTAFDARFIRRQAGTLRYSSELIDFERERERIAKERTNVLERQAKIESDQRVFQEQIDRTPEGAPERESFIEQRDSINELVQEEQRNLEILNAQEDALQQNIRLYILRLETLKEEQRRQSALDLQRERFSVNATARQKTFLDFVSQETELNNEKLDLQGQLDLLLDNSISKVGEAAARQDAEVEKLEQALNLNEEKRRSLESQIRLQDRLISLEDQRLDRQSRIARAVTVESAGLRSYASSIVDFSARNIRLIEQVRELDEEISDALLSQSALQERLTSTDSNQISDIADLDQINERLLQARRDRGEVQAQQEAIRREIELFATRRSLEEAAQRRENAIESARIRSGIAQTDLQERLFKWEIDRLEIAFQRESALEQIAVLQEEGSLANQIEIAEQQQILDLLEAREEILNRESNNVFRLVDATKQAFETGFESALNDLITGVESSFKDAVLKVFQSALTGAAASLAESFTLSLVGEDRDSQARRQAVLLGQGMTEAAEVSAGLLKTAIISAMEESLNSLSNTIFGGEAAEEQRPAPEGVPSIMAEQPNLAEIPTTPTEFVKEIINPPEIQIENFDLSNVQKDIESQITSLFDNIADTFTGFIDLAKGVGSDFSRVFASGGSLGSIFGFARGGVVTEPTLSVIGEGRYNEAVVPLPDGKSIPIDVRGSMGSDGVVNNVNVSVSIDNNGNAEVSAEQAGRLGKAISQAVSVAVQKEINDRKRPGGSLSKYGVA